MHHPTRALALLIGLAGWLLLCSCSGPNDQKRERLLVYAAGPRNLAEQICAEFTAETGIEIDLFAATTGQLMAKLEAERYRPRADVILFASRVAAEALKEQGRLLPYPDPPWREQTETTWHDPDDYYFATGAALVGLAIRSETAPPPPTWEATFTNQDGLRQVMPSPSRSGSSGDFVIAYTLTEEAAAWPLFLEARAAGLDFAAANSQAISGLLVGAYQQIVGAADYLIYRQIENGAPLQMAYPGDLAALVTRPVCILKSTPNPEAARRLVDFYFSENAQRLVAASHLLPARLDTPLSPVRADDPLPKYFEVDSRRALREQTRILRRFQLEVERAAVVRRPTKTHSPQSD